MKPNICLGPLSMLWPSLPKPTTALCGYNRAYRTDLADESKRTLRGEGTTMWVQ
ncbi:MAG: hypothetical protein ABSF71_01040 [Terriglobia bacterium]|jgi:hypothetical protein